MSRQDHPVLIYTTFESLDDARAVGGKLVDLQLAACVNILPGMTSIYEWQGRRQETSEVVMFIKTRIGRLEDVMAETKRLHPYETPALLAIDPREVDADFAAWILEQTTEA